MPFCFLGRNKRNTTLKLKSKNQSILTSPLKPNNPVKGKRVSLSASVTVEASLVVPLYVFAFTVFCYVLLLLNFQVKVDKALYNTARTIAKYAYTHDAGSVVDAVAAGALVVHEVGTDNIRNMGIVGGSAGFHFLFSDFEDGIVDLVVQYNVKFPFSIIGSVYLPCTQRARTRAFIGITPGMDGEGKEAYVYVTQTGKVYHKSLECTYLKLSIREVAALDVNGLRNQNGERYSACEICTKEGELLETAYVTDFGNRYHASVNCSGLKRGIIKIKIEDAAGYRPCSRCGG